MLYDLPTRREWDPLLEDLQTIERYDEYQDVIYFLVRAPITIADREFLQNRARRHRKDEHIILFRQGPNELVDETHGVVRAETIISGYVIRPDGDNGTKVTVIAQNDIKGMIPKAIVNMFAASQPLTWFNTFKKEAVAYAERYWDEHGKGSTGGEGSGSSKGKKGKKKGKRGKW
eukprot:TRINITY_DN3517_c0_g3_i3.p1 TRINITY_DN3517_c0_g3~~TRINITY_DN3517_c0_g3_i3.p1  ORF type:complete len:174 (+),score=21.98 TRINITY_DN3517_c0_g3_i3:262-783(+)